MSPKPYWLLSGDVADRVRTLHSVFIWLAGSYLDTEQPLLLCVASFAPVTCETLTSFVLLHETLNVFDTFRYFSCTIQVCRPMFISL